MVLLEVLVTVIVVPIGLVHLSVECLPGEVLPETFQVSRWCHMLIVNIASVCGKVMFVALGLRFHLKDQVARLCICIIWVEDT